jgi:hypothetical protein
LFLFLFIFLFKKTPQNPIGTAQRRNGPAAITARPCFLRPWTPTRLPTTGRLTFSSMTAACTATTWPTAHGMALFFPLFFGSSFLIQRSENIALLQQFSYVTMRDALNATGRPIFYSMEGQAYFPDVHLN